MKVSDFNLLSTLPEEYDYELFNDNKMVIGKQHQTIIGFLIKDNKLLPITFDMAKPIARSS